MHDLVAGLLAEGVPVHCIGIQAYLWPGEVCCFGNEGEMQG